jgi:hypothetical protein
MVSIDLQHQNGYCVEHFRETLSSNIALSFNVNSVPCTRHSQWKLTQSYWTFFNGSSTVQVAAQNSEIKWQNSRCSNCTFPSSKLSRLCVNISMKRESELSQIPTLLQITVSWDIRSSLTFQINFLLPSSGQKINLSVRKWYGYRTS